MGDVEFDMKTKQNGTLAIIIFIQFNLFPLIPKLTITNLMEALPYGFRDWTAEEMEFYRSYCSKEVESQRELWEKALADTQGSLPVRSNNTKKLIRKGIPREYRTQVRNDL